MLQGNPGRRPLPDDIPAPAKLCEVPKAPLWLDKLAKKVWNEYAIKLVSVGIVTEIDTNILALYCKWYSILIMAAREIDDEKKLVSYSNKDNDDDFTMKQLKLFDDGSKETVITTSKKDASMLISPYFNIFMKATEQVKSLGADLGLSPAERSRLHIRLEKDNDREDFFKQGFLLRQQSGGQGS